MTSLPPDVKAHRDRHYWENERLLLKPQEHSRSGIVRDTVLRSLDPGRRGVADSGDGRPEMAKWGDAGKWEARPDHLPQHICNVMKSRHDDDRKVDEESQDFLDTLFGMNRDTYRMDRFPMRRLRTLVEEWELVWENGQNNPRAARQKKASQEDEGVDRGRFPYIDEQAGLLDELSLPEILRLNYKTKSRHHPKWKEIRYDQKRGHTQYLRRRQMNQDEAKARMGVIRQALADA